MAHVTRKFKGRIRTAKEFLELAFLCSQAFPLQQEIQGEKYNFVSLGLSEILKTSAHWFRLGHVTSNLHP